MKKKKTLGSESRREFLKAGVAGGAALLTPAFTAAGSTQAGSSQAAASPPNSLSPGWTKDLIIYEIGSTRAFTSPNGPGTGTFGSMAERLAYLEDLGITGIWVDPPSLQEAHRFFYNMWCRYAVMEPDQFDPVLGTEEQLRGMVEEAHRRGIRVFPDVKTHGVMDFSPLVKRHPEWFRGSHWRMADYDWYGGHTDLDDWWVKTWSDCITKYKVDGFRLDVDLFRPDLWKRIRENAAAAGHPVIIWEEDNTAIPGVTEFSQHDNAIYDYESTTESEVLTQDLPGFYERKYGEQGHYRVVIEYADGAKDEGSSDGGGSLRVHLDGLTEDKAPRRKEFTTWYMVDGIPDVQLTIENAAAKKIANVTVHEEALGTWHLRSGGDRTRWLALEGEPPTVKLYLATVANGWPTIQLSCHDQGWDGFPLDKSPYTAQGSRALMGYSALFAPAIPIFFAGEEFNATFRPLPWQSPYLYGGKDPGKGRWLYGCMLDWQELHQAEHRAMLEDVKKMIAIRKREADVLAVLPERERPKLMAVPCESNIKVPRPYIRWSGNGAILVAANRDTDREASLKLQVPLQAMGLAGRGHYRVTDLWPGGETKTCAEHDLAGFACTVVRDKTPGGGLRVLKIMPGI